MADPWVPPRPTYHLRIFVISLVLITLTLLGILFGVHMEALVPATGIITARDEQEVRTTLAGLVEPGWYESSVILADNSEVAVRLDAAGDGLTDPAAGQVRRVRQYRLDEGREVAKDAVRFHRLQPGDELWAGQVLASIRAEELRLRLRDLERQAESSDRARHEADWLRHQLDQAVLRVPRDAELWLVLEVPVSPLQAVQPGDTIARIAPLDAAKHQPRDLVARLQIDEKYISEVRPDQPVRIYSNAYNHRLHGHAWGLVERLEPWGEAHGDDRRFHVLTTLTETPVAPPLGSSCRAEIVVGRKTVYRIILEH